MSRIVAGGLVLLALAPPLGARDDARKSPAEQVRALEQEYQKQLEAFNKEYREAKTQEERNKVFQEKYPSADKFGPRFLKIAEAAPEDPAAFDALAWVVRNVRQPTSEVRRKAVRQLARDHARDKKMGTVCSQLAFANDPASQKLLRQVMDKNPDRRTQASAALALAQSLKRQVGLVERLRDASPEDLKRYEQFLGKDAVEDLRKKDARKLAREMETLFERVADKYADVKTPRGATMGDLAGRELFEIRNLAVGKEAPDIEGEDIDGKKFKLSDYRGKVVLLDFWGNW